VSNALAYNSLWQVRTDAWSRLEESAAQLLLAGSQHRPVEQLGDTIGGLLDVLGPIERFWAFPGIANFAKLRRLFAAGKYDRFAALITTSTTPWPPIPRAAARPATPAATKTPSTG
jgi:arginine decarboxylase